VVIGLPIVDFIDTLEPGRRVDTGLWLLESRNPP